MPVVTLPVTFQLPPKSRSQSTKCSPNNTQQTKRSARSEPKKSVLRADWSNLDASIDDSCVQSDGVDGLDDSITTASSMVLLDVLPRGMEGVNELRVTGGTESG